MAALATAGASVSFRKKADLNLDNLPVFRRVKARE
jgi:hypothetical protein